MQIRFGGGKVSMMAAVNKLRYVFALGAEWIEMEACLPSYLLINGRKTTRDKLIRVYNEVQLSCDTLIILSGVITCH